MRKLLLSLVLTVSAFRGIADEGIWLPFLLGPQVYNNMVKKGLKLSKDQLYHVNKASLKDAIVLINGSSTASVISSQGLIISALSQHKETIAAASSASNKMLHLGYYAPSKNEEIPTGAYAEILLRIEDVTQNINDSLGTLSGRDRLNKTTALFSSIANRYSDPKTNTVARVTELFKGKQYLVFVYQRYNDIRLAGLPDSRIGEFGGVNNSFSWPAHSADFVLFRIYTNAAGTGGNYAITNIPMTPKTALPISLKGFKEGDFTLIAGYPSTTDRYALTVGIEHARDITNPTMIALRSIQQKAVATSRSAEPNAAPKFSNQYDKLSKELQFYTGEKKQLGNSAMIEKIKAIEQSFNNWTKSNPEYQTSLTDLQKAYDAWKPYSKHYIFMTDGFSESNLVRFATKLQQVENALVKRGSGREISNAVSIASKARSEMILALEKNLDQKIIANTLLMFYNEIEKNQHPISYFEGIKGSFGDLKQLTTYEKYIDAVYSSSMILDETKWNAFTKNPDANVLQADAGYTLANAFLKNWQSKFLPQLMLFNLRKNDASRRYFSGIMKMDTLTAQKMYPDADSTLRISYGSIQGFTNESGVKLKPVSTISQMIDQQKDDILPATFKDLALKKDFGVYADKLTKTLVTNFITNNDFTCGNSGSPILDANGNLIGLGFSVNSEGLGFQYGYNPDKNRVICTDIRFILWCIDKTGGNSALLKEMKILK